MTAADRRSFRTLFSLLFVHPLGLFRKNPGIFVVILVVISVNLLTPEQGVLNEVFERGWIFDGAPGLLLTLLRSPLVVLLAVIAFLGKNVLSVAVSQQLMLVFQKRRTTLRESVRTVRLGGIVWLTAVEICVYAGFALCAMATYVPALLVWRISDVDLTIPFLATAVLASPAFYAAISTTVIVSVLPTSASRKTGILRLLLRGRVFWPLYAYCAARVVTEAMLLAVVPLVFLDVLHSRLLASVAIAIGLLLPFVLLRGASYALTLDLMKSDEVVSTVFADYFRRVEPTTSSR